ncbi:MAG: cold shock domain-containing protein [Flavobacteriales bacterium]|nr:cold shock domain-containing protein [Flavobacteriales bacterium]MCB9191383.1 cold shock domain-containing protein [Flavobacteriales bacterium]MCB9203992.1 cold shock domain-containing protein [Flavobacteriales bacterium]
MGRSQETFGKKEREKKKAKKRKEKEEARLARKESGKSSFDDMIAYVDADGNIVDTPPEPVNKKNEIKAEDIVLGIPKKDESEEEDTLRTGVVSFFNHDKGYGFIKDSNSNDSMFVHINNVLEEISEGNKVTFEVQPGLKGPEAAKVQVVRD